MTEQFLRCLRLIDTRTWVQACMIGAMILLSAGFEAIGIGLIFPFIQLLADPSAVEKFEWIDQLISIPAFEPSTSLLIKLAWGLMLVFVLKNLVLTIMYSIQVKFLNDNQAMLSMKVYRLYLFGPYRLHLTRNSAELITNIVEAANATFAGVCMGYITLLSEAMLILGVTAVLFTANPSITLGALLILAVGFGGFFLVLKTRLDRWGMGIQEAKLRMLLALQQGLHNFKEVKVLGREEYVADRYRLPRWDLARVARVKNLGEKFIPRIWMELLMVTTMLGGVIYFFEAGEAPADLLATISLFAAAAFRLLPAANRALIALNGIKAGNYAVDTIYRDVILFSENEESRDESEPISFDKEISLNDVSFVYPNDDRTILDGIDLKIEKGQSIGLVGPSGSGKTTLVDIILGLLPPSTGTVTVDGRDISPSIRTWRRLMGYVPQQIYLMDDTLTRNIAFGIADDEIDPVKLQNAIQLARLEDVVARLPEGIDTPLGERGVRLSGGEAQRVGIARALYNDPPVLVLDEATAALDNETEREINLAIERLSGEKTLIIIAHRLSTVRKCSKLVLLRGGKIAGTGSFDVLIERDPGFKRMVKLAGL